VESTQAIEDDLEEALKEQNHEYFMELLVEECGDRMRKFAKRVASGMLTPSVLAEVHGESLMHIWKRIREPDFSLEKPMAFVFTVIRRRVTDRLRKENRLTMRSDGDDLLGAMAAESKGGGLIRMWRDLSNPEQDEFSFCVRMAIAEKLTSKQRLVAQTIVDQMANFLDHGPKACIQAIQESTGERMTAATISSHWRDAKKIICRELAKSGFSFVEGE